ncbi:MAG TPA: family 20 glycosylhydrolase [Dactylosporangium sp.]|nr:family 20 glycosylhydrolase [Dactylosporangium sp.]
MDALVPAPVHAVAEPAQAFTIEAGTAVHAAGEALEVAEFLAGALRLPVLDAPVADGAITLRLAPAADQHPEGYALRVSRRGIVLAAAAPAGLFAGVQTLLQLLSSTAHGVRTVAGGQVRDYPRFAHRGAMLDVSRHFFTVGEVRRFIDQLSRYKMNVLHLHLTDDQGWRLEIKGWPRLAVFGGRTRVGGGPGGHYTQREYRDLVAYAARRFVTVIPEIDVPGHTTAALASYPELNPDGVAPDLFTGRGNATGFSSLATGLDITYRFMQDVLRELAALTPGPYLHIGTDETHATPEDGVRAFLGRVLPMVAQHGKRAIGWHEILRSRPDATVVPQYWGRKPGDPLLTDAVARGHQVILSPADKVYLDMKYDEHTPVGYEWAGHIDVADIYGWDPGAYVADAPDSAILGVEAPLWAETLRGYADVELMAFPRLVALAELGWSPRPAHDWPGFARRLALQGPTWEAQGVNYCRSPQIPWIAV